MSSYTSSTPILKRVQYDPAADGSVIAEAFFEARVINDADPSDFVTKPLSDVRFVIPPELASQIEALARAALTPPPSPPAPETPSPEETPDTPEA